MKGFYCIVNGIFQVILWRLNGYRLGMVYFRLFVGVKMASKWFQDGYILVINWADYGQSRKARLLGDYFSSDCPDFGGDRRMAQAQR